jgi:O-antigen/teichoic acid export membrane protein
MTTGLPLAADFYLGCQARPRLVAGWRRNREVLNFGISRVASAGLNGARQTTEQMTMVGAYDFAALGMFTRAIGLATLISGRFGSLVLSSLYPAITRAEAASEQFRRAAGVSLRGIAWVTIPASCFLGIAAEELVRLLYGPKWDAVASLLPLAAAQVGVMGLGAACYGLLLANQSVASCLAVDIVSGTTGIVLALVFIPRGIETYLLVLLVHGAAILTLILVLLWRSRGIAAGDVARALLPPALASLVAAAAAVLVNDLLFEGGVSAVDLAVKIVVFGLLLAGILRIAVPAALDEMLHLVPGGRHLRRMLRFA